jgi:2'-5' RNA ligase
MPRLFTGLEIPDEIADELAFMRGGLFGARWIDQEYYHLTLRFIGDIDHATAREVFYELERINRPAFTVTLDGLGAFGGDRPRALVATARSTQALLALQAEHERAMRRVGLPIESRKYTPHVTLARLRGVSPETVAGYLANRGGARSLTFEANRFILYSARDSVGGGPYIEEASYPLRSDLARESNSLSA